MSSPAIYELTNAPITAHSFNKDRKFIVKFSSSRTRIINAYLLLELVVCPNTNDAQIYQYGHSNSKLEATLKGVSDGTFFAR